MSLRNKLILASRAHYDAHIRKHTMNVEVILSNPLALPEHTDLMDAIEKELHIVDEYQGKLDALNKYFKLDHLAPKSDDDKPDSGNSDNHDDNSNNSTSSTTSTTTQADTTMVVGAGSHINVERPFTV
jgi:hypothetical protein